MPGFLTQIAPIKAVKILSAREVSIAGSEIIDFSETLDYDDFVSFIPAEGELPVTSVAFTCKLLEPAATVAPTNFPLGYEYSGPEGEGTTPLFYSLTIVGITSVNLFPDLEIHSSNSFVLPFSFLEQSDQKAQVSNNLLIPLDRPAMISGMGYADRYWKTEKVTSLFENPRQRATKKEGQVLPRDLHEINGIKSVRPRFKPSFWDLVFVLLQPPLEFGHNENLLLPHDLYPYQIEGVKFLVSNEHALLADDMGTGKTVMTIVALKLLMRTNKIKHALVLCPSSILYEWKKHLALWAPEMIACFVRGTQEIRSLEWDTLAHVYVTTYDTLRSDVENDILKRVRLNYFDVVVVDEAHHIKNAATNRARAIKKLRPVFRWALTGTPIQNKIEDMAAIFDFVYPNYLTPFDLYEERIKLKVAPHFLRRRKKDVLKDLPPKIKQDIWLDMSSEQQTEYLIAEREIQTELEGLGSGLTKQHIFAKMQRLKQICNFPPGKSTSPKSEALKEQVEEVIESGNKVIVFSQYVNEGVNKLTNILNTYGTAKIVGGQSDAVRGNEIDRFKKSDEVPILVASVKSGGEGLNLTEASYVVHFDHWWNPAVMWQAEDRVHRRGQTQNVNVYSYWMNDTIDQRIYKILERKGLLIQNVVDGLSEETIEDLMTMDDLLEMMGVRKPVKDEAPFDPRKYNQLSIEEIHRRLFDLTPRAFEDLVKQLMHYLGYPNVKVTKMASDGGIDVLSTRITERGIERIAAQCKRYRNPVGVQVAREFQGAIQDDKAISKGYLVTTSEFTSECISYCIRQQIEMIPGLKMAEYVRQFGLVM